MPDFYSEHLEDLWIRQHTAMPEKGVFVDCGCYHPQIASNTAHWRDMGWTGLAIDANRNLAEVWKKFPSAKFVNAAIGPAVTAKYQVNGGNPGWSRVGTEGEEVLMRTLESILVENGIGKIDLLSLDLEGMEYSALLTMDLDKHEPTIIIAEYDTAGLGKDYRVLEYLLKNTYVALHMTETNVIYRRVTKSKLPTK